jgi:hypothetical protein
MNNLIRFNAYDNDILVAQSPWTPEHGKDDALRLLTQFRAQHSDLAYRIERTGDSKVPNLRQLTRFQIKVGDDLYYSREFEEHEVGTQFAAIRERWPNADITAGVRYG